MVGRFSVRNPTICKISSGNCSMSSGMELIMPSDSPFRIDIPASRMRGRFSMIVLTTTSSVSTTEGTSSGRAEPMPLASVTTIWAAASISKGTLLSSPCPRAPRSCIPASISVGSISIIMPTASLRMPPSAPIAPLSPPSWKAEDSVETAPEPN